MSVNKNTVSRAYQSLTRQGYVSARPGKGTFVVPLPAAATDGRRRQVEDTLRLAAQEARLAGLGRRQFLDAAVRAADRGYGRRGEPNVGYVDCVSHDATHLSAQLQQALDLPVAPLLLGDVLADPDTALAQFDLVGVSMSHLAELAQALQRVPGARQPALAGLLPLPDAASLDRLARLPAGSRVAVVCDQEPTLRTLLPLLHASHRDLRLDGVLTADPPALAEAADAADIVAATVSAATRLPAHVTRGHIPVITISFRLELTSIEAMAASVRQLTTGQVTSHGNTQ